MPAASVNLYKAVEPWKSFKRIVGVEPETPKCEIPTISYENGKLKFGCATERAEYVYEITDPDVKKGFASEVQLSATYTITVYATKLGYDNSDTATATLCWLDAEPNTVGMTNNNATARGNAILIQNHNGILDIMGVQEGATISVFTQADMMVGSAKAFGTSISIDTNLRSGEIAIVKIGDKSLKVLMK